MRQKLLALKSDTFLRHNAVFLVGSIAVGALNYLFYPVMGRLLEPSYFGEVQVLFSLLSHLAVLFNVLGMVVVNIVANQKGKDAGIKTIIELEKFALLISAGLFLLFLGLLIPLKNFFQFGSVWPFLGLGVTILLSVPGTFRQSVLQGAKDFAGISWAGIVGGLSKLILAVILVLAGFNTGGAVVALLLSSVFVLAYMLWRLKRIGRYYALSFQSLFKPDLKLVKPQLTYSGLALVVSLVYTLQYTVDVLAVKHYFPAHQAGLYAGISTIANIIFFATGSVAGVLLASIKIGSPKNLNLLKRSLFITTAIAGGILAVFVFAPKFIVTLLIGSNYAQYAHYLPSISLALFLLALGTLFFIYHLALRHYVVGVIGAVGSVVTLVLMVLNHTTIQAIINNVVVGSLILLASIALYSLRSEQRLS